MKDAYTEFTLRLYNPITESNFGDELTCLVITDEANQDSLMDIDDMKREI